MRSSWGRAAAVLAVVAIPALVLAGCSEKTPGNASASTDTSTPTSTVGSGKPSSTSKAPVSRPKTINLKSVDPCTLLTDAQKPQFGLDRPPQPGKLATVNAPNCTFSRSDRTYIVGLAVVTEAGIAYYTDGSFDVTPTTTQIGGFPAVLGKPKGASDTACFMGVDVSDGQFLNITVNSGGETAQAQLCELVPKVAEAAIATLAAR
jgi:hypothetical protein